MLVLKGIVETALSKALILGEETEAQRVSWGANSVLQALSPRHLEIYIVFNLSLLRFLQPTYVPSPYPNSLSFCLCLCFSFSSPALIREGDGILILCRS